MGLATNRRILPTGKEQEISIAVFEIPDSAPTLAGLLCVMLAIEDQNTAKPKQPEQ